MSKQRSRIKEIFLNNGFTIKAGHDDLKEYVYAAAEELLNSELAALKEENERLKDEYMQLFNKRSRRVDDLQQKVRIALDKQSCPGTFMQVASDAILEHGCAEIADLKKALENSQARVAELESIQEPTPYCACEQGKCNRRGVRQ